MIPAQDFLVIVTHALVAAGVVGGLGALLLLRLRQHGLRWLLGGLAVITIASVVAAVLAVTRAMFLSRHDAEVAVAVVITGGIAALVVALVLSRIVTGGARALSDSARTMSVGAYVPPERPLPAELASVAHELAAADVRLRDSRAREVALEASRRELVAWVSHDLRSPLAALRAMAEALEDGVVTEPADVARYHSGLRRETDRLAAMVDDLFELSRIHAGALRLAADHIAVEELVSEVIATAEPVARSKGVHLQGAAEPGDRVVVDAGEMSRVLRNLVANAIRHTPSDGTVAVAGSVTGGHACFVVADSCGGIPEDDLDRVFDVAFRGEAARTPSADNGAGLGLAIARGIVEAHDGRIAVRNAGAGCRFEVRIPVAG